MFKKVLIAEDYDSANIGVISTLAELGIAEVIHVKYCDDAMLKIKKALFDNQPFDLLLSDLSFQPDARSIKIASGEELVAEVRKVQPDIKVIVLSVEERPARIRALFDQAGISGYISKGRESLADLKAAIKKIYGTDKTYISSRLSNALSDKSINEIDDYDKALLKLLAQGLTQKEIAKTFKETNISPSSESAVEKRISKLKIYFRANNNVQIVFTARDLGFI